MIILKIFILNIIFKARRAAAMPWNEGILTHPGGIMEVYYQLL
ncbi:hypothetical protein DCCM_2056 [Desulfocucumis palustris]|uniref:Uncharacterized protein n=1 Tax=Desulfocucumis palustris TaxID=1898651 RepID=A0A2L2X9N8_9FIRM|nr:hypothetical protein DCCM_2056 [Desulfocucumis palustris]